MVLKVPKGLMRGAVSFGTGFIGGLSDQYAAKKLKDDKYQEKLDNLEFFEKEERIKAGLTDEKNQKNVDEYLDILAKDLGQGIDREWFDTYAPIATTSVDNAKTWLSSLEKEFGFKPFNLVLAPEYGNVPFKDFYESQYSTKSSSKSTENKDNIISNVTNNNNVPDNTANVLLADSGNNTTTRSDSSGSYSSSYIPFNSTAITGTAKRKRVNSQFFTHPDLGVIEAYQYETSPGSNVGGGVFFTMMQNDNNEFGQVQLNQSFFNDVQEGIANRSVKNFEYFDSMNNKHHVISGYEQGGINYVTGIPTSIASTLNYEFFDKKYTANYNVQDVLKEDFLGEDSTYRPFLMKLDDFNLLFQSKTKSDGLFTPLTSGGKSDSFGTSQGDIKSFNDIFASTSNIATKDNFITIGEGPNATTELRFVGGDARDLAGQNIGVLVSGMVDNHNKGSVPQETYDALGISSISSKNNLIANAGAYTSNFVNRIVRNEINALKDLKGEEFNNYITEAGLNFNDYTEGDADSMTDFGTDSAYKTVSNLPSIEAMIALNNSLDEQQAAALQKTEEFEDISNKAIINKYFPGQIEDFSSYVKEYVRDKGDREQVTMLLNDLRAIENITEEEYNLLEAEAKKVVDTLPDFEGKGPDSLKQEQAEITGTSTDSVVSLSKAPPIPEKIYGASKEDMDQNKLDRKNWMDTYGDSFFEDSTKKTQAQLKAIEEGRSENNVKLYVDTEAYRELNNIE